MTVTARIRLQLRVGNRFECRERYASTISFLLRLMD
jgi:hypothetical protein